MPISVYGFGFNAATHSASAFGIPVNAMHEERKDAPASMNMIMHDSRVAPMRLCQNVVRLSPPDHQAIASEPSTPYAAASVAVAHPMIMTQTIKTISARHGMRWRLRYSFCENAIFSSSRGVLSGLSKAHTMM